MGIFSKLSTVIKSNINDLISRAENPEKMLNQIILDMRDQLAKAKREVAAARHALDPGCGARAHAGGGLTEERDHHTRLAGKIENHLGVGETGPFEEIANRERLVRARLHRHHRRRAFKAREASQDRPIPVKTVGAAAKRDLRIMVAHLRLQMVEVARRHIGRVGDHDIDRRGERLGVIGASEQEPSADTVTLRVAPGDRERPGADIDTERARLRQGA